MPCMDLPITPHLSAHVTAPLNNAGPAPVLRLCRMPEVIAMTGLSIATIYRLIKAGTFPQPRSIGGGMIGFIGIEVERWILDRPVAVLGCRAKRLRRPSRLVSSPRQLPEAAATTSAQATRLVSQAFTAPDVVASRNP